MHVCACTCMVMKEDKLLELVLFFHRLGHGDQIPITRFGRLAP